MIYTSIHWSVHLTWLLAYQRIVNSAVLRTGAKFVHINVVDNLSKCTLTVWRRIVTLVTCSRPSSVTKEMLSR